MRVLLGFDSQFCGKEEIVITCENKPSFDEIKAIFRKTFGISYNDNCYFKTMKE